MTSGCARQLPEAWQMFVPGKALRDQIEKENRRSFAQMSEWIENCSNPPCQGTRSLETVDGVSVCTRCGKQSELAEFVQGSTFDDEAQEQAEVSKFIRKHTDSHFENVKYETRKHRMCHAKADVIHDPQEAAIKRRVQAAREAIQQHFTARRTIPQPMMQHVLDLFTKLVRSHDHRINNVLSAVCACVIVVAEQFPAEMPLNVHTIAYRCGIVESKFQLDESVKRFLQLLRQTLNMQPPSFEQLTTRWVHVFQNEINEGKLCELFQRRIDAQLQLTLEVSSTATFNKTKKIYCYQSI